MVCTQGVENPIIIHSDVGTLREVLRVPKTTKIRRIEANQRKKKKIGKSLCYLKLDL